MTEKKTESKEDMKVVVVNELPQQPYNVVNTEGGKKVKLVTVGDALTEILEAVREMKKAGLY